MLQVELYDNLFAIFFLFSEIGKVRGNLFQINGKKNEPLVLPDAAGPSISLSEKVYVPIKEFPDVSNNKQYNHNLVISMEEIVIVILQQRY